VSVGKLMVLIPVNVASIVKHAQALAANAAKPVINEIVLNSAEV